MKITKETTISVGTLIAVVPLAFWFFTSKADKADVEKIDEEVDQEENINVQQQQQINFNTKLIEKLDMKFDKELAK